MQSFLTELHFDVIKAEAYVTKFLSLTTLAITEMLDPKLAGHNARAKVLARKNAKPVSDVHRLEWTTAEVCKLKALAEKKTPVAEIAKKFNRTENALRQKAFSLKLSLASIYPKKVTKNILAEAPPSPVSQFARSEASKPYQINISMWRLLAVLARRSATNRSW